MTHLAGLLKGVADATDAKDKESISVRTFNDVYDYISMQIDSNLKYDHIGNTDNCLSQIIKAVIDDVQELGGDKEALLKKDVYRNV